MVLQDGANRAPSAALINYGQRADLLRDILSSAADSQLPAEQKYWIQQTAHFKRGIDVIIPEILAKSKPKGYATALLVSDQTFALSDQHRARQQDGSVLRQSGHMLNISRDSQYVFLAYARQAANIQLYLTVNNQIVAQETDMRWFPAISLHPSADAQATLWIVSPEDHDVSYTLRIYKWQKSGVSG